MLGATGGGGLDGSSGEGGSSPHDSGSGGGGGGGGGAEVVGRSSIMSGENIIGDEESNREHGSSGGGGSEFYEGDRSTGGNRWPRQETLALLKIRSDMDGVFRDSSLKGPLWEQVSRKMAELGYHRSSKKCKEKFENVYKYHKRTKDGRVGKSEGKTYRFFDQLQALEHHHQHQHQSSSPFQSPATPRGMQPPAQAAVPVTMVIPAGTHHHHHPGSHHHFTVTSSSPQPISVVHTTSHMHVQQQQQHRPMPVHHGSAIQMENGSSPSATPSSSSLGESEEEEEEEDAVVGRNRKRKWKDFFERLTKEVVDKQEELHRKFLDAVDKRERDRLARDEAWRAQEMGRLNREHQILVQERSMAAAKDAALMAFLQKLSDQQQIPLPLPVQTQTQTQAQIQTQVRGVVPGFTGTTTTTTHPQSQTPTQSQSQVQSQSTIVFETPISSTPPKPIPIQQVQTLIQSPTPQITPQHTQPQALVVVDEINKTNNGGSGSDTTQQHQASQSRWPKAEVEALINLRTKLDEKYQETGPKGPLWEEISSAMKTLGYNRNAKRCKEKWENINKYFKKVKESNKRRPEDSKTCPYFHQLDALYRGKTPKITDTTTNSPPPPKPDLAGPVTARPDLHWPGPAHHQHRMEEEDDGDDGDDDEDDEEGSGGYEIVANNNNNINNAATTTTAE
ncbi:hypothetical protein RND81_01G160700 [Saponaria officinalis]|uniref:Myb-like domain-containing protein n=1 Tax=Saponaria officinalis TaxID=3572 RepID=A0AAW1NA91_SAPOF